MLQIASGIKSSGKPTMDIGEAFFSSKIVKAPQAARTTVT
jgi:hypothetical protein